LITPLDALIAALEDSASYNANAEAPPRAILWCDEAREFSPLLPLLRDRLPQLLTLGDYDPGSRTGPAIWLRVAAEGLADGVSWPPGKTPVLHLPGIGREILRGAEDCPALLQPLVWYTIAGTLFGHVNGKDWTLRGFLAAERGRLRLEIADDAATREALNHAATRLCTQDVQSLRGRRWDAGALHTLLAPDLAADMLDWMDGVLDAGKDEGRFAAFCGLAVRELGFDPRKLTRQDAARRLAEHKGKWADVWKRFARSTGYAGVVALLSAEEPPDMFADKAPYPKLNAQGEKQLREDLAALGNLSLTEARGRIAKLEGEHSWRRDTVWAKRGEALLAQALLHLAQIAKATLLPGHDGTALAEAYKDEGSAIDHAACMALAAASRQVDREAVAAALHALYLPWVEEAASTLQELVRQGKVKFARPVKAKAPETILFVDGLRMDLAHSLLRLLAEEGVTGRLSWTWSGFPTVTATCKTLVSPIAQTLRGPASPGELLPVAPDGKPASKPVFYKALSAAGWQTEDTLIPTGKLWTETGRFDEEGHALGARLPDRLAGGLRDVVDRVLQLARSGRSIRVVTDHGWLLMPGGLPVAALDPGLVEPKGKHYRYAMIKSAAETSYLQVPWSWNPDVFVAAATGARVFLGGEEYAHGGISPQECVLPVIEIEAAAAPRTVSIERAVWEGLRLRVQVSGGADLKADVRLGEETSGPTLAKDGRILDADGRTAILISDEYEGKTVCLVVINDDGAVLAHRRLTVGVT